MVGHGREWWGRGNRRRRSQPKEVFCAPHGPTLRLPNMRYNASLGMKMCTHTVHVVFFKLYPLIAPLGEAPLPLQEIRAGVMGASVRLLPGRCSKIMKKYLPVRAMRDVCLVTVCVFGIASFAKSPFLSIHLFFLYNGV